jgi:mannosyltransferase OCH1-like enzyme
MQDKIQSFWYGNTISTMERLCISSFLQNGHTVDIYTYEEIRDLPLGTNQLDANLILPKTNIFYDNSGGIAAFSDWFRYKMLYEKGGWWIDLDVICLKPFSIIDDYCFATENFSSNYETGITCCVIKSQAYAEFLKLILERIETVSHNNIEWGTFGPGLIHAVLQEFDSAQYIMPVNAFCPVDWTEMTSIVREERDLPSNAFAIHMWNNLWRIHGINKETTYHPNCIYEKLKAKYLMT